MNSKEFIEIFEAFLWEHPKNIRPVIRKSKSENILFFNTHICSTFESKIAAYEATNFFT